jgi:glycine cleavage system aminomethyltransferase T
LVGFSDKEIDFEAIDKLENSHNAHTRDIDYAGINRWTNCKNGLIALSWMLYPDGRYFADEDGFGMEDNDEVNISAYIDTQCRVVVKFQDMEDSEKRKQLREEALKRLF